MKGFNAVDGIVVAAYFVLMLGIGLYAARANRSARDYFAGGNRIPWWVSGMTMYMANFSAWTFTGAAGFAYETGWFAISYFAVWPFAYLFGTLLTAARWRRTRSLSPVEYTRTRFTPATQQVFSWVIGTNFLLTAGVQLAAVCTLLAPLFGVNLVALTVVTGIIILLYTFFGGVWAVSITDVVQGLILLGITFIVLPLSVAAAGGFSHLVDAIPAVTFSHVYGGVKYDANWLVSIFVIMGVGVAAGQAQRFYSVRDERAARRTGFFAAALFLTVPFVFGIPPLAARVLWPDLSAVPFFAQHTGGNPRDLVFIALCMKLLPNGLIGFFAAAMLAATMSTLSSVFNMVSSIAAKDVYQGMLRPDADDARVLRIGRLSSIVVGLIVTLLAVLFITSRSGIFNIMQALYTLLNIPIVVPIAAGLISRRASRKAALVSMLSGLAAGLLVRYVFAWDIGPQVYLQLAVTLAAFLLTTAVRARDTEADGETVAAFFAKLDTPVDAAREVGEGAGAFSPMLVTGAVALLIAVLLLPLYATAMHGTDAIALTALVVLLAGAGALMYRSGRQTRTRDRDAHAAD